jgi:hypothetical protein
MNINLAPEIGIEQEDKPDRFKARAQFAALAA